MMSFKQFDQACQIGERKLKVFTVQVSSSNATYKYTGLEKYMTTQCPVGGMF